MSNSEPCYPSIAGAKMAQAKTEMPEKLAEASYEDIQRAWEAYNQSEITHPTRQLNWVFDNNHKLSQWEIDQLQKTFEKFQAKYQSPLAKAMK